MIAGLWWLFISLGQAAPAQAPPPSITGTVVVASSSQPLAGVRVVLVEADRTTMTDAQGRFAFDLIPPNTYTVTVSAIGYVFVKRRIVLLPTGPLDITIPLVEGTGTYQESVTVAAESTHVRDVGVSSSNDLGSADLEALRGIAGDDPMRAVQALPGVVSGDEFQSQFSMRGSDSRQVGVVIDGVATPLLLNQLRGRNDTGSIAMINSDVLDSAVVEAGPRPERDGQWLGATVNFGVREGSRDRVHFGGAASGTSASGVFEGPIGRAHRGSWLVSARQSYLGWLVQKIAPEIDSRVNFNDTQSKFVFDLTSRQQIQFLVIAGTATYEQGNTPVANGLNHANSKGALASIAWRYARPSLLVTERVSVADSWYHNLGLEAQDLEHGQESQQVERADVMWMPGGGWTVEFGGKGERDRQDATLKRYTTTSSTVHLTTTQATDGSAIENGGWAQLAWRGASTGLAAGARVSRDTLMNATVAMPWLLAEQRVGQVTFRAGAGTSAQFEDIDTIKNAVTPLAPERARAVDVGLEYRMTKTTVWQATVFGRDESDGLRLASETHASGGTIVNASTFPTFETTLTGRSRGLELSVRRRATSGLTGWVSYAWAHTRYHDVVTAESFDGDFDQRHTVNVFLQQRLSWRTTVNAKLRVGSNVPLSGYFSGTVENLRLGDQRNLVRLPMYARLDLRADRTFTFTRARLTMFVEVINVLNRQNLRQTAGAINASLVASNFTEREVPIVPSIGMRIEF